MNVRLMSLRGPAALLASLISLVVVPTRVIAQTSSASISQEAPVPDWTYGGFLDVAYLDAFNDPPNKLFRSRGTAFHVDDVYVNMSGAYVKKKTTDRSRWGGELLVQTGKDDEIFGLSATAPNMRGTAFTPHLGLANVSYLAPAGRGLTIQGGIFPSLIGYDSLYAKDNLNYTRPWGADFSAPQQAA